MIDLNVMDWSSNKEQEENYFLFHRQCVNRYMNEINIKTSCKNVFVLLILTKSSVHLIKLLLLPLMVVESFVAYDNDPRENEQLIFEIEQNLVTVLTYCSLGSIFKISPCEFFLMGCKCIF